VTPVPDLTCIVIAQRDETTIEQSLSALRGQATASEIQVVVVVSGSPATAAAARRTLPTAEVVEVDRPVLPGEARNLGLERARGNVVSFPGSHVVIAPGSLEARIRAHAQGYAMVTGILLNGTRTWAGWAAYFLENAANLPGLPAGELDFPPVHCSYLRTALDSVSGFPPVRSGEDTEVNQALHARGYRSYRETSIELYHHNPCHTVAQLFRHQLIRGSGWGRLMRGQHAEGRLVSPSGLRYWLIDMLSGRIWFIARHVLQTRDRRLVCRFVWSSPLIVAGALAGWIRAWLVVLARRSTVDDSG